jgi:hypothetical protein
VKTCPGCGMPSIPVVELHPRPVPAEGRVLFVATLEAAGILDEDLAEAVHSIADTAAPGRATVVILSPGDSLDMVGDDDLAAVGLQRIEP